MHPFSLTEEQIKQVSGGRPDMESTMAIGEEGGYTTYALGEEGGEYTYVEGEDGNLAV